eukprot:UN04186
MTRNFQPLWSTNHLTNRENQTNPKDLEKPDQIQEESESPPDQVEEEENDNELITWRDCITNPLLFGPIYCFRVWVY